MTTSNKIGGRRVFALAVLALLASIFLYNALFSFSYSIGPNYRNVSVDTRVNITNSKPDVISVVVENPITLNAGGLQIIWCNATVRHYSNDSYIVSAFFWDNLTDNQSGPDHGTGHYTNTSCTATSIIGYFANYTCNFSLQYYANNGSQWICNVTATSTYPFNGTTVGNSTSLSNTTTINALLALNVTSLINYGNMAVGDTSTPQTANVTNFGNQNINISVRGYGNTSGDGLAFVCMIGNITVANEKYSLNKTGDFVINYLSLSSNFTLIPSLTLPQQTNDSQQVINSTYWRLYIPPNPFGQCNGTVVFEAEAS